MSDYLTLEQSLELIDSPNREICSQVLKENHELFYKAKGSSSNHQAWKGGYIDHLTEIMNIAVLIYEPLNENRKLPFSISDVLLSLFLHDIEKPFKQAGRHPNLEKSPGVKNNNKIKEFRKEIIKNYKFNLTEELINAIDYAEGEGEDYTPGKRVQTPLAAFVHMCDVWSARGWHDFPKKRNAW